MVQNHPKICKLGAREANVEGGCAAAAATSAAPPRHGRGRGLAREVRAAERRGRGDGGGGRAHARRIVVKKRGPEAKDKQFLMRLVLQDNL